ncbi:RecB family exonuclease [Halorubrum depositum]|uniref:RecB family exonuclease n=1 Tax=Halorubrum depositum TaxID=2583992 RepID=UPI0011A70217|nr:PD-(D/E)XK nuclease family protein [Halorubrum depositum]
MSKALTDDGKEIDLTVPDDNAENGLEHISKSRIKTYLQCPRKFLYLYWMDNRTPGSYHTEKGSQIHRAYETFHENLIEYVQEHGERPEWYADVMGPWEDYAQWLHPHIENFWKFEDTRWELALDVADSTEEALDLWLPLGVEVEGRLEGDDVPIGSLPWMGYADALLHAATVPGIEADVGVVIVDYKTGKVQDEQYRHKGIYLEGEFYGWLFENELDYEIAGVAGYYPQEDELVVSPYPDEDRRHIIRKAVLGMQMKPEMENYELNTGPLCHYGHGKCFFYDDCPSTWGKKGGEGYHGFAEPDGSTKPKDEITDHKRAKNWYPY